MKSKTQGLGLLGLRPPGLEVSQYGDPTSYADSMGGTVCVQNQALPAARACKGDGRAIVASAVGVGVGAEDQKSVEAPREGGVSGSKSGASAPFLLSSAGLQPFNATEPFRTPSWPTEPNARFNIAGASRRADLSNPLAANVSSNSHHSGLNSRRSASQIFGTNLIGEAGGLWDITTSRLHSTCLPECWGGGGQDQAPSRPILLL